MSMALLDYHADTLINLRVNGDQGNHRIRVHATKVLADGTYDAAAAALAGKLNVAGDADVVATAAGLMNVLRPFYFPSMTLSMDSVDQRQDDGSYIPIAVTPPATQAGTNSGSSPVGPVGANQTTFNMRDTGAHRTRLQLMATPYWSIQPVISAGAAGGSPEDAVVAFIASQDHPIVSKHGMGILKQAHITCTLNRRVRRRLGWA